MTTLYLIDEIHCQFTGLHPEIVEYFFKKLTHKVPNAHFIPAVKLGYWDGKKHFFSSKCETYISLLPEIIPDLVELDVNIEIVDRRKRPRISVDVIDENVFAHRDYRGEEIIFRDYQVDGVNTLIKAKHGILMGGTGAGKTFICGALCKQFNEKGVKCLVIVPDLDLLDQTYEKFSDTLDLDCGIYSGSVKDTNHKIVISTWQSLQNSKNLLREFGMLIVDEVHGAKANVLNEMIKKYGNNISARFGTTATMPEEKINELSITSVIGVVKYEIPAHELIKQGVLSKINIEALQFAVDLRMEHQHYLDNTFDNPKLSYAVFKTNFFPDYQSEIEFLRSDDYLINTTCEKIEHIVSSGGNTMVLVDRIKQGNRMYEALKEINPNREIYFVHGEVKNRKEIYDTFEEKDHVIIIATVNVAGKGIDLPRLFNVVLYDLGKSFTRILQAVGRTLRKAVDKDEATAFDFSFDTKTSRRHLSKRIKQYADSNYPCKKTKIPLPKIEKR
jgi:superfamily II DNA or RNA helicase